MRNLVALLMALNLAGATAQTSREWRDSLSVLNRMIEQQPRSTDLRLKKAAVNIQLGQWEYAIEEYGNVLSLDKDNLAALYFRAYGYTHERLYAQARSDYETFLKKAPLHMEARLGLAMVCEKMGRTRDALDEYNQLVEMFPDSAVCYAARAAFETTQKQYDVALYDWDEAIKRKPENTDYIVTKVDLLIKLYKPEEAKAELEKALQRGVPRGVLREWFEKCRTTR